MSSRATHGLMLWDGKSLGTLVNIVRLRRQNRTSVVYLAPQSSFIDLKNDHDLLALAKYCSTALLQEAEQSVASELGERGAAALATNLALF